MNTPFMRSNLRSLFTRCAVSWCACAAIFVSHVPARADDAGMAVLKSARWRSAESFGSFGPHARAAVPGGGPIIGVGTAGITAIDRASGKRIWLNEGGNLIMGVGDKTVLVQKQASKPVDRKLFALSAADGTVAYEIAIPQEYAHNVPDDVHVIGKTVIIESYTLTVDPNSVAVPPIGRVSVPGPRVLTAYDLDTGKELWKNNSPNNKKVFFEFDPAPSPPPQLELRTTMEEQVIDSATGKPVWSVPLNGKEHEPYPLVPGHVRTADGTWFFLERAGDGDPAFGFQLIARDGATGKILRQHKIPDCPGALAAVAGQLLIMRECRKSEYKYFMDSFSYVKLTEDEKKDKLTAIDMQTGKIVWTAAVPTDNQTTRVRVADDLLLAGEPDNLKPFLSHGKWNMIVLEAATGKTLWSKTLLSDVVMHKDLMIFALVDQVVGANRRDGRILWSIPSGVAGNAACNPFIADGTLYLSIHNFDDPLGSGLFAIPLENNPALTGPRP